MKISVIQMCSSNTLAYNEQQLFELLEQVPKDTELVFTPENALHLAVPAHPSKTGRPACVFNLKEPVFERLKNYCTQRGCQILLGSVPVEDANKNPAHTKPNNKNAIKHHAPAYNATCLVDAKGVQVVYKKIHLFDVNVGGEISLRESASYKHGTEPSTIDVNVGDEISLRESASYKHGTEPSTTDADTWRLGLSICYDVRFAELYSHYAHQQVDIICVPAAFLVRTGRAHWHTLLRARAVESQAYVVAAAQCGIHQSQTSSDTRRSYGHSLIISPWGEVLAEAGPDKPEVLNLNIEKSQIKKVRQQIPMHEHRQLINA